MLSRVAHVAVLSAGACSALACSGIDVIGTIGRNRDYAFGGAVVNFFLAASALAMALVVKKGAPFGLRTALFLTTLAALHPYWIMSATSGDCGYGMRDMTEVYGALAAAVWIATPIIRAYQSRLQLPKAAQGSPNQ